MTSIFSTLSRPVILLVTVALALGTWVVAPVPSARAADVNAAPVRTIANTSPTALNATFWVATPGDGYAYVASRGDRGGSRSLLVFDQSVTGTNTIVRSITAVEDPTGVTVHDGLVYVTNPGTGTVQVFESGGAGASNTAVRTITGAGHPHAAAVLRVGGTDYLYVADNQGNQVRVYLAGGNGTSNTQQHTLTGGLSGAQGITAYGGEVFVASRDSNEVRVFDADGTGKTSAKRVLSGLSSPLGVTVEPSTGTLFVSNTGNNSVNAYPLTASGSATPSFRITGANTGLSVPSGMSVRNGNLYVANWFSGTVTVYSAQPRVTGVTPASGRPGGTVTITGGAFTGATSVTFGSMSAPFTVDSDEQITATVPTHPAGAVTVSVSNALTSGSLAAAYTFTAPSAGEDYCTNAPQLVNGDFDDTFPVTWNRIWVDGSGNPKGYQHVDTNSYPGIGWRNTAENLIELIESGANSQVAQSGGQYAELNATTAGTLYQDVTTVPGQTMSWSFHHRARNGDNAGAAQSGTNTMRILIGTAGNLVQQGGDRTSGGTSWTQYTGTYTVPAGQTTTRFAFQSVSPAGGIGNLLDSISFTAAGCASAPGGLSATPGDASATISFSQQDDGGDAITNYAYRVDGGAWTALSPADAASPVTVPGLTNGTSHSIRLRALNSTTAGFVSDPVTVTPYTTPAAPTAGSPTRSSGTQGTVSVAANGTGGAAITGYQYSLDGGAWQNGGTGPTLTLTGLTATSSYSVRVRAVNTAGAGTASDPVTVPKAVPATPNAPTVRRAPGSTTASAFWTAPNGNAAPVTGYRIQVLNAGNTVVRTCITTTTRCTLAGLPTATPLRARVAATNTYGYGDPSSLSSPFTITPAPPGPPTVALVSRAGRRLTITVRPGAGGLPTSYTVRGTGDTTKTCTITGTGGTCSLLGLTRNTPYTVRARATNTGGTSLWGLARTFSTRP